MFKNRLYKINDYLLKIFYPPYKTCKILFITEIATLWLLGIVLWKSQYYKKTLVKLNLYELKERDCPDYLAVRSWTNTLQKMRYDVDIAFFGNSITEQSDFQSYFPSKKIVDLGYGGDTMEGMMRRMNMLRAVTPEKVFLLAGINGLDRMPLDDFEQQYNSLLDSIHTAVPQAQIYVQSILPIDPARREYLPTTQKVKDANMIIKNICNQKKLVFIDIYKLYVDKEGKMIYKYSRDGVHLHPFAYKYWAKEIRPYILN